MPKQANRPSRRTLVRWNDDHDKELLLWIVYCCNEQGMKIPFARIAQCMGASFTEGACIQHLAKIRNKMEEAGLHVPPTQKRGTVTRQGSSIYRPRMKEISGPVPRVRPPGPPTGPGQGYLDSSDEEDEEDLGEHTNFTPPRRTIGRKTVRLSTQVARKDNTDEEASPSLYDSDKEYGAKKPSHSLSTSTLAQEPTGNNSQVKITMGNSVNGTASDQSAGRIAPQSTEKTIGAVANESLDSSMTGVDVFPLTTQSRRRKSSAITAAGDDDQDDEDYSPQGRSKGRTKKAKASRTVKKQKTNDKTKVNSNNQQAISPADMGGYEDASNLNVDRMAMPPPSMFSTHPNHNPSNQVGWNNNFMQQPFTAGRHGPYTSMGMNSTWNTYPSAQSAFDDNYFTGPDSGRSSFNASPLPSFGFDGRAMTASPSVGSSRHHSFASNGSTSTIESQPMSWTRPVRSPAISRSPGFPNPQEASMVLHGVINQSAEEQSMFHDPLSGGGPPDHNSFGHVSHYSDGAMGQDDGSAVYQTSEFKIGVGADEGSDDKLTFDGFFDTNEGSQLY